MIVKQKVLTHEEKVTDSFALLNRNDRESCDILADGGSTPMLKLLVLSLIEPVKKFGYRVFAYSGS
jgi:hypothetical protein